jgi:hypothetical protein
MATDQTVIDTANQSMIQRFVAASNQGLEHGQRVSSEALSDVQHLAFRARKDNEVIGNLVLNRIISDQTGEDDVASERILTGREVQDQPQEGTLNDPNYRGGASAPTPPPSASKSV